MTIIDAQVHTYERDHAGRPWRGHMPGPPEVTGATMVAAMDEVGVDGAILVSPFSNYRYDPSYALEVHAAHPGRFGLVSPVDSNAPNVAETIAAWAATDGAVGVRLLAFDMPDDAADPGLNRVLAAAARHDMVVNIFCWQRPAQIAALAARNPNTRIVVDHLGLEPHFKPPLPPDPFARLAEVLALAAHDNIAIKISGACPLSLKPYPYDDIWAPVARVIDAFGLKRCMWGTDWTRATAFLTYKQGVDAFRLHDRFSDSDRAALMGGTLARVYDWSPRR